MPSVTDNGRGRVGDDSSMRFRPPNRWSILLSLRFGGENTCRSYCRSLASVEYGDDRLRYQPVRCFEVFSRISNELRVGWMVDRLHARDHVCELGVMQADEFNQFGLCIGGPGNQNRACI